MNDNFKKLLAQTELLKTGPTGSTYVEDPDGLEQFAELIVQECARVVADSTFRHSAIEDIKNHFGVK